uniref:Uncharacterized protein n=1 Tax=Micrurus lemniscatus lemniscatus TaxID=129467 RepID=A0A2D4HZY2_MICLE
MKCCCATEFLPDSYVGRPNAIQFSSFSKVALQFAFSEVFYCWGNTISSRLETLALDDISVWGLLLSDFPRVFYNPSAGELYSSLEEPGSGLWVMSKVFCI